MRYVKYVDKLYNAYTEVVDKIDVFQILSKYSRANTRRDSNIKRSNLANRSAVGNYIPFILGSRRLSVYTNDVLVDIEDKSLDKKSAKFDRYLYSGALMEIPPSLDIDTGNISLVDTEVAKIVSLYVIDMLGLKRYYYYDNRYPTDSARYCNAGYYSGGYSYVDIKSFYYNIYKRYWGAKYRRGLVLTRVADLSEFFDSLDLPKMVRVIIYGIFSARHIELGKFNPETGEYYKEVKPIISSISQINTAELIHDTSIAIGKYAVECGCVYANVDGFIIPNSNLKRFTDFLTSLGFSYGIKAEGFYVDVKSVGCYAFFNENKEKTYETKHYDRIANYSTYSNLDIISYEDAKFILRRLMV